jgi:hypothetical protein
MEDFVIDDSFRLVFTNGDFAIGESTLQNQQLLLLSNKGDWRESPEMGVGILTFLKDEDDGQLLPEIKQQFEKDGMTVKSITQTADGFIIDAPYQ